MARYDKRSGAIHLTDYLFPRPVLLCYCQAMTIVRHSPLNDTGKCCRSDQLKMRKNMNQKISGLRRTSISIALGAIALLLVIQGLRNFANKGDTTLAPRLQAQAATGTIEGITVDTTSDPQVTGYPDSRKIVRDSRDNLYVAYRNKIDDGSFHIFVAKLPAKDDKFTNTEKSIETELLPYTQRVPSIALDEKDTLHVVWYGEDAASAGADDRQIKYTRSPVTANGKLKWAPVIAPAGMITGFATITPTPTLWQEHPVIFAAPKQTLYIVWEGKDSDHPQNAQVKWIKSRDSGATWSAWQNIPGEADHYYSRPTILATSDGRKLFILAYATAENGTAQIVWTQSLDNDADPGDRWDRWRYIADLDGDGISDSTQDQRHLSVVMDSNQALHLLWRQRPDGDASVTNTQIHYATYAPTSGWRPATLLMQNFTINQSYPSITVDKDDRLWAVWSETVVASQTGQEPESGEIHAAKQPKGGAWQAIETPVHSADQRAFYPSLRWQRYGPKYGVDLVWVESTISDPTNTTCMENKKEKCKIYYANLAGQ